MYINYNATCSYFPLLENSFQKITPTHWVLESTVSSPFSETITSSRGTDSYHRTPWLQIAIVVAAGQGVAAAVAVAAAAAAAVVCVTDIALSLACTRNVKTRSRLAWVSSAFAFFLAPFPHSSPLGQVLRFHRSSVVTPFFDQWPQQPQSGNQRTAATATASEFLYRSKVVLKFN